jgi:hypothetical protein
MSQKVENIVAENVFYDNDEGKSGWVIMVYKVLSEGQPE